MKRLGILGASRFGHLLADLARDIGGYDQIVFFDDYAEADGERVLGKFSDVDDAIERGVVTELAIAVGYRHFEVRERLYKAHLGRVPFATLVHPTAWVSPNAKLAEGVQIYSMSNVEKGAVLAANVTVFNQTSITHEVEVGAHSFLSVGVSMGGGVSFGTRTFIGVGASIVNDVSIGDDCLVCGGTILTGSIGSDTCVVGNPYKVVDRVKF